MKQFSLEEYLKNPSKKVMTRDGHSVRIRCTDKKGTIYPVVGLVDIGSREITLHYTREGENWISKESPRDLFFATKKKKGWVNVYKNEYGAYVLGEIFIGKEHEEVTTGLTYITTAKIEWEE